MTRRAFIGGVLLAVLGSVDASRNPAAAATRGDPSKGAARAEALFCAGCHGPAGRSATPEWPSLAGQRETYIAQQLTLFRARERTSQEMAPIAAPLTDEDIADLSAYYAAQTPRPPAAAQPDQPAAAELYRSGDAARSIQACAACHGPDGRGDESTVTPALRSQQPAYVRNQLEAYSRRTRYQSAVPAGVQRAGVEAMYELVVRLTGDESQQLAQYLQNLP